MKKLFPTYKEIFGVDIELIAKIIPIYKNTN